MRTLKFRAWDGNKMTQDFYLDATNGTVPCVDEGGAVTSLSWKREWKVMQSTGLLDKNGKEIFEGDIVRAWVVTNMNEWEHMEDFKIEYRKGCFCLCNEKRGYSLDSVCRKEPLNKFFQCEVVGNIYETPELLNGKA